MSEQGASSTRRQLTVEQYVDGVRAANRAVLGRAISLVESNAREHRHIAQEVLTKLLPHTGNAHRVGISGVPGVGKSTFIEALGSRLTSEGNRVAVLAVDPSSERTRGSILGDKTRMVRLAVDPNAFIRPSPAAGSLGGVGRKTRETILLCEAAGFDVVLVETVGVGQSETRVADMVDFFLVLMLAGAGDELQGIKRGILEVADMVVVNKADGDNRVAADRARRQYDGALRLLRGAGPEWQPPVLTCSALEETGLDELWQQVTAHRAQAQASRALSAKRQRQHLSWMWTMVDGALRTRLREHPEVQRLLPKLEADVQLGKSTASAAAEQLLAAFGLGT